MMLIIPQRQKGSGGGGGGGRGRGQQDHDRSSYNQPAPSSSTNPAPAAASGEDPYAQCKSLAPLTSPRLINDRWRLPKLPLPLVSILDVSATARRARGATRWSPGTGSLVMPWMSLSGGDRTLAFMGDFDRALVHNAVDRVPSSMPDLIDVA